MRPPWLCGQECGLFLRLGFPGELRLPSKTGKRLARQLAHRSQVLSVRVRVMASSRNRLRWALCLTFLYSSLTVHAQSHQNDAGQGAQRFMEYCAACHGADGKGGDKGPALVGSPEISNLSDSELTRIVHDGTRAGMPPFAQIGETNIAAVVQYLRSLENHGQPGQASTPEPVTGDIEAGRALYFGKAQCSSCHMMRGKGGFIAGSLTNYARNRAPAAVLEAITNPDTPLVPSSRVATVTTKTGNHLTGVMRNEDNFTLALQTEDGRYHLLSRSDVSDVQYTEHSLMPHDYGRKLSPKELNDIVSFLVVEGRKPRSEKSEIR